MPFLPPTTEFPEPDTYVRYREGGWKFIHLQERYFPLRYPRRLGMLDPGEISPNPTSFDELNPSQSENHIYLVYLGLYPELSYQIYQPINTLQGRWDQGINAIDDQLTYALTYGDSPYDAPTHGLWIVRDKYPAIRARNVGQERAEAKIFITGALYRVQFDDDIDNPTKDRLIQGSIASMPISLGGEF